MIEILLPLVTIPHYQSLKEVITITFIVYPFQNHPKEALLYNIYLSMEHVLPTIIDLFHHTLNGNITSKC